jgi:hypothetical protein
MKENVHLSEHHGILLVSRCKFPDTVRRPDSCHVRVLYRCTVDCLQVILRNVIWNSYKIMFAVFRCCSTVAPCCCIGVSCGV